MGNNIRFLESKLGRGQFGRAVNRTANCSEALRTCRMNAPCNNITRRPPPSRKGPKHWHDLVYHCSVVRGSDRDLGPWSLEETMTIHIPAFIFPSIEGYTRYRSGTCSRVPSQQFSRLRLQKVRARVGPGRGASRIHPGGWCGTGGCHPSVDQGISSPHKPYRLGRHTQITIGWFFFK